MRQELRKQALSAGLQTATLLVRFGLLAEL
jgi:hypothetical protein